MAIPKSFENYVYSEMEHPDNVEKLSSPKIYLTHDEAKKDYETFKSIIMYAYSGRQYWENRVGSFINIFNKVERMLKDESSIHVYSLCDLYYKYLNEFIVDNHLRFYTILNGIMTFKSNYYAYFSDIIVDKNENLYKVIESNNTSITTGDLLELEESNVFKTLSPTNKQYYLVGMRSWKCIDSMSIICNEKEIVLPLHKCRASEYKNEKSEYFCHNKIGNVDVVTSNTFDNSPHYSYDNAKQLGSEMRKSKMLIWNLCNNGGGSSDYADYFIRGLNEYSNAKTDVARLHSNHTENSYDSVAYYNWEFSLDEDYDYSKSKFEGQLYLIINSNTASSGETGIGHAKSIKNCITIGENSYGCGVFGELKYYQLPYSHMIMAVPSKIFIGDFEEGVGYTPDYWVDKEDVQNEVLKWIFQNNKNII